MEMTKDEKSLLLYLEQCAVDYGGKLEGIHMNSNDFAIANCWNESGFVRSGRIAFHDIKKSSQHKFDRWCVLSDAAWTVASTERRARCQRLMDKLKVQRFGLDT